MFYYPPQVDLVLDFDSKLYIGDVQSLRYLQSYNIGAVISVCPENMNLTIDNLPIQVNDKPNVDIQQYFQTTNKYIESRMDKKQNILVHCMAGKSRSATIVLAYLIYSQKWSLQESLIYLKSVRPMVCPNPGFIRQLLQYEKSVLGRIKSKLTYEHTPYYSVQNPDTCIPGVQRQNRQSMTDLNSPLLQSTVRRISCLSPPILYGCRY
ncbi:hypothetical protein pb186bvf_016318 [Paramecium bursaria]